MIRKQGGFTLVELIVAMAVFILLMAAALSIYIPLVNQFKQQTKIAGTNIEGIVGLEMLKADLEQAGFGLPWYFPSDYLAYNEAAVAPANASSGTNNIIYNDSPTGFPPRAVVAGDNVNFAGTVNGNTNITGIVKGSDYLVIKSTSITGSSTSQKWTYILNQSAPVPRQWGSLNNVNYDPASTDRVIVINPQVTSTRLRQLVVAGTSFSTQFSSTSFPASFSPPAPTQAYLIYDVDPATVQMPFNRADYYVGIPAVMPQRCANGTGVLYKAVMSQAGGTFPASNTIPLLDCVADMQVVFGFDMDHDGIIGTYSNADASQFQGATSITGQNEPGISAISANQMQNLLLSHPDLTDYRNSLMEVRIYILAHEGQMDPKYTYANNSIIVGPSDPNNAALTALGQQVGRTFNFAASGITNWQNYRWKLYSIVVKLQNMR